VFFSSFGWIVEHAVGWSVVLQDEKLVDVSSSTGARAHLEMMTFIF
jgi:hypothetical protein